jgi:hypothetical protein
MKKETTGLLFGAGVGALLGWLIGGKVSREVKKVPITLKKRSDGTCGVEKVPDVEISSFFGPLQWVITNPKNLGCGTVTVRIDNWTKDRQPSEPPVITVGNFEREVQPGQHKTIPAAGFPAMEYGDYHYDVLLDGERALDPIVKLVL